MRIYITDWFGLCAEADADWFGLFALCIVLEFCAKFMQYLYSYLRYKSRN